MIRRALAALLGAAILSPPVSGAAPSAADFARLPAMSGVAVAPDGQRIAFLRGVKGQVFAFSYDLVAKGDARALVRSEAGHWTVDWCRFKSAQRIVCGFHSTTRGYGTELRMTRLAAIDADGTHLIELMQNSDLARAQFQDRIIDWLPGTADKLLVALNEGHNPFPGAYELDVRNGGLRQRVRPHDPITNFFTDPNGTVRLGCGYRQAQFQCFTRESESESWRLLSKYEAFIENGGELTDPLGFGTDRNILYSRGPVEDRLALWRVDLNDRDAPVLEFMHPLVDLGATIKAHDGHLLAVRYDTELPQLYYLDHGFESEMRAMLRALPGEFAQVVSGTRDGRLRVVHAFSDVDPGAYYLYDRETKLLSLLGRERPWLDPQQLAVMRPIEYPARDGTRIPAYLTVPRGADATHLPLIVMPHGGPRARTYWGYNFLVQFLASRGYAVLQMNFRGSTGYGGRWYDAARQDWGGLTYRDIEDATHWAVQSGLADPARVAIVGWSFGGYAALLAAERDGASYRCAVAIAGPVDLAELHDRWRLSPYRELIYRELGTDRDKLKADSPVRHAADVATPLLLVHGTIDVQVDIDNSRRMDSGLRSAHKPHEYVELEGEGHQIDGEAARTRLLETIEHFLLEHMGPGVSPPT